MLSRRSFLSAFVAAPAVCYAAHLMPLRGEKLIFQRITFPVNSPHMTMGALPEFGILGQLHYENTTPNAVLKRWNGKEWVTHTSFSPLEADPEVFAKTDTPIFYRAGVKPEGATIKTFPWDFESSYTIEGFGEVSGAVVGYPERLISPQEANEWGTLKEHTHQRKMIEHSDRVTERAYELWDGTTEGEFKARQQAMREISYGTKTTV